MKTARLEWKQCLILDDKIDLDEYKQIKNNLLWKIDSKKQAAMLLLTQSNKGLNQNEKATRVFPRR